VEAAVMDTERLAKRRWQAIPLRAILLPLLAILCLGTGVLFLWAKYRPVVRECRFYEKVTVGDLQVEVRSARSRDVPGQKNGRSDTRQMLCVIVRVNNTNPRNAVEWAGWQGRGIVEDEYGCRSMPADLTGWSRVPEGFFPEWDRMPINTRTKIAPGEAHESVVFFERALPGSREAIVTFPLDGVTLRFRGTMEYGEPPICELPPRAPK
jgi:hypothetical protein